MLRLLMKIEILLPRILKALKWERSLNTRNGRIMLACGWRAFDDVQIGIARVNETPLEGRNDSGRKERRQMPSADHVMKSLTSPRFFQLFYIFPLLLLAFIISLRCSSAMPSWFDTHHDHQTPIWQPQWWPTITKS